ncbi:hypothetical protein KR51_00006080 [Rubidibacter lacunae KORDI 51-2]|uniref:Cellulose-binding protein n=1 Tax=Rubidibacter lacunae KORDI 51-2 TaxID=582515 RepID=U5DQ73_9CHRO|nr:hypothetical protein [Rubidibacter lacunae]ERN42759.1 hypothetical protein KR51_00006080 [Rubidibacter lacunae KORDI 51-2]
MNRPPSKLPIGFYFFALSLTFILLGNSIRSNRELPTFTPVSKSVEFVPTLLAHAEGTAIGTNLAGAIDYSTEYPFVDLFKMSRPWIPQSNDEFNTREYDALDLDERGWVRSLPETNAPVRYRRVVTLMHYYNGGEFVVLYDGEGTLEYSLDVQKDRSNSQPGRDLLVAKKPSDVRIGMNVVATDPNKTGNYIRNIRVLPAEFESTYQETIFNPVFLARVAPFSALRFMDWMSTNNSDQQEWSNRPQVDDARYSVKGVPLELMIRLANALNVDPWFTIPHRATDEYVANFAQLVREQLDRGRHVYVEYTNEAWNSIFEQFHWLLNNGIVTAADEPDDYRRILTSYTLRALQIGDIWRENFQDNGRTTVVLGTQTASRYVADVVTSYLEWAPPGSYSHGFDALAITGYFGRSMGAPGNEEVVQSWLDGAQGDPFQIAIAQLKDGSILGSNDSLVHVKDDFEYYKQLVVEHPHLKELLAYEANSHVAGYQGVQNNEELTRFFIELHRRPEFYDLYTQLLETWQDSDGVRTLFMNFSSIGTPTKYGSWGVLESVEQTSSPRYSALVDFIARQQAS